MFKRLLTGAQRAFTAWINTRKATISAKVIRADGTIEDLGVISRPKVDIRNLFKR